MKYKITTKNSIDYVNSVKWAEWFHVDASKVDIVPISEYAHTKVRQ
jgi:hypothetical protein